LRLRIKPWLAVLLIAVAAGLVAYLVRRRQHRYAETDAEMVALLPHRDLSTVFVNVSVLRRAGLLSLLQTSRAEQDVDYRQFVRETGFDYTRDIEAIAARGSAQQVFLVIRGKFDWIRLREYAAHHGGSCNDTFCQALTTRPGRWASYLRIQSDMVGLAVSGDPADVLLLSPRKVEHAAAIPSAPLWVSLPHSVLSDPKELPLALRLFALAVQSADSVVLSAEPGKESSGDFSLRMEAVCPNAAIADTARTQLEIETKLLNMELQRERQHPSRADLTGLLTAGSFRQSGKAVIGSWPVYRDFLQHLQ
jgi:hypothetical protein